MSAGPPTTPPHESSSPWDVIAIGAGAAGLMAAAAAAARGRRTLLLEKNRKLGVKILISGGTRCNITHACGRREIVAAFGPGGKFLHSALAALPPEMVVERIEREGVPTKVEATGKVFPVSDRALDVRDALVRLARKAGATIRAGCPVTAVERNAAGFVVQTPAAKFRTGTLLITTGGQSYPGCGTTGDGYAWARQFGHSLVDLRPALTPIVSHTKWLHALQGIAINEVTTSVVDQSNARVLGTSDAPILFTHFGVSGPGAMNVSRYVTAMADPRDVRLEFNLFPESNQEALLAHFRSRKEVAAGMGVAALLEGRFPKRVTSALLAACNLPAETRVAEISKHQLSQLATSLSRLPIPVHGTLGYKKAEVTAGGVALDEVDSRTLQSKLHPGLYFAGEILDLDGPIGGFNFQSAFSTGWLAGQHV